MEMEKLLNDGQKITAQQIEMMKQPIPSENEELISDFSRFYTEEEFYKTFKSVFQFAGERTGIQSLQIRESEERGARITSNRIYEMAVRYAFLNFLIDKTTSRLAETIMMIQFLALKSADVYYEKSNRNLGSDLWVKIKKYIKRRKVRMDNVSEFSEQVEVEKQQKPVN